MKPNKHNFYFSKAFLRIAAFLTVIILPVTNAWTQELSIDELVGNWEDNSSWDASGDWDGGTVPTTGITRYVTIQGDISVSGSLDFSHTVTSEGLTILANDKLTIYGDLIFTGADMTLDIQADAVLKVYGNLDTNGSTVNIVGDGIIVVTGDMTVDGGSTYFDSSSPDDLYVDGTITGNTGGNGKNFNDGTTDDLESNHTALYNEVQSEVPVVLLSFNANAYGQKVRLDWATASEENFDHFEIQRSNDGTSYHAIGEIEGHGNSTQVIKYNYTDNSAYYGTSYYRLNAIDFDGTSEVFESIRVDLSDLDQIMNIYPNPLRQSEEVLRIDFKKDYSPDFIAVYDALGRIINKESFHDKLSSWQLNKILPKGIYHIRIQTANQTLTKKFLVN